MRLWAWCGLIEPSNTGAGPQWGFEVQNLGEYAAARCLANLGEGELGQWVVSAVGDARLTEPLLLLGSTLAGNAVAERLLGTEDSVGQGAFLAAAVLSEGDPREDPLLEEVGRRLRAQMESDVPDAAYDAAERLSQLAVGTPSFVAKVVEGLDSSPVGWTRVSVIQVQLACGEGYADPEAVRIILRDFADEKGIAGVFGYNSGGLFSRETQIRNNVTLAGIEFLLHLGEEKDHALMRETFAQGHMSKAGHDRMRQLFTNAGLSEFTGEWDKRYLDGIKLPDLNDHWDRFVLAVITGSDAGDDLDDVLPTDLSALASVYRAMDWGSGYREDFHSLEGRANDPVIAEVLRGTAAACSEELARVREDARWLSKLRLEQPSASLYSVAAPLDEPDWRRACRSNLQGSLLVKALDDPSGPIASTAMRLLGAEAGGESALNALDKVLAGDSEQALLLLARIAFAVWGDAATDRILDRLGQGVSSATSRLLLAFQSVPRIRADPRAKQVLVEALTASAPGEGLASADHMSMGHYAARELALGSWTDNEILSRAYEALNAWLSAQISCEDHGPYYGSSCPTCHTSRMSPIPYLVAALSTADRLDLAIISRACTDERQGAQEAGYDALLLYCSRSAERTREVYHAIAARELPLRALQLGFGLSAEVLAAARDEIAALLRDPDPEYRETVIYGLGRANPFGASQLKELAEHALQDSDPEVKNAARSTLISLSRAPLTDRT
jgi:hypothetical protein